MSGHGFHVHGPHDHEMEHVAQHGASEGHASQLAVVTAILATVGALFGYMAGATQANAGLYKNNAAIKKTEASNQWNSSNQWNYYQAKSSKQNLAELALELAPESRKTFYVDEVRRYKTEKSEIQVAAKKLEDESTDWDHRSDHEMHTHHRWAPGMTALQVAIAMAAIALLTRRKLFEYLVYGFGTVGVAAGGFAWFHL
jgi:hypothetical protein